jgi:hypothetical protein
MATGKERVASGITGGTTHVPRELPTREEVELAAYQIYVARGRADGYAEDDWFQAERDLMEEFELEPNRKSRARGA